MIEAVKRLSIAQQVVEGMKDYIMSGEIQVGNKLPTEKELCTRFKVGRGTIREALCTLQALGFVEMQPGKGAYVASVKEPSKHDLTQWFVENEVKVKDVIEVRNVIEPLAIKLAMQRTGDEEKNKLQEIHQGIIEAVENDDILQISRCDEAFHTYIVECSKNNMLISIDKHISEFLKNFRSKTFRIPHNVQNVVPAFIQRLLMHSWKGILIRHRDAWQNI